MEMIGTYGEGAFRVVHAGVEYRYPTERKARAAARAFAAGTTSEWPGVVVERVAHPGQPIELFRAFRRADGSVTARVIS